MPAPEPLIQRPPGVADSGILAHVSSPCVVQAARTLPDPACVLDDVMSVDINATRVGRVRLTFKRQHYGRARASTAYFAWHCVHAVPVPAMEPAVQLCLQPQARGERYPSVGV